MTLNDDPRHEPKKNAEGARPTREIVSKLSEHEKTVRDQELLLNAEKYFGGLNEEEKLLLGLSASAVKEAGFGPAALKADEPSSESMPPAALRPVEQPHLSDGRFHAELRTAGLPPGSIGSDWVWAGLTALIFVGVVGWVLAGR